MKFIMALLGCNLIFAGIGLMIDMPTNNSIVQLLVGLYLIGQLAE